MAIQIQSKEYKRVDLVAVVGRIDSSTVRQLEQALQKIIKQGRYRIVVDLSETEYISSAGLRTLISTLKQVRRFNRGDLRLAGMPDKIKKVFGLVGFLELFQIYDECVDAVASF